MPFDIDDYLKGDYDTPEPDVLTKDAFNVDDYLQGEYDSVPETPEALVVPEEAPSVWDRGVDVAGRVAGVVGDFFTGGPEAEVIAEPSSALDVEPGTTITDTHRGLMGTPVDVSDAARTPQEIFEDVEQPEEPFEADKYLQGDYDGQSEVVAKQLVLPEPPQVELPKEWDRNPPSPPIKPATLTKDSVDKYNGELDAYRSDVDSYNRDLSTLKSEVNAYNEVVTEYKQKVKDYQDARWEKGVGGDEKWQVASPKNISKKSEIHRVKADFDVLPTPLAEAQSESDAIKQKEVSRQTTKTGVALAREFNDFKTPEKKTVFLQGLSNADRYALDRAMGGKQRFGEDVGLAPSSFDKVARTAMSLGVAPREEWRDAFIAGFVTPEDTHISSLKDYYDWKMLVANPNRKKKEELRFKDLYQKHELNRLSEKDKEQFEEIYEAQKTSFPLLGELARGTAGIIKAVTSTKPGSGAQRYADKSPGKKVMRDSQISLEDITGPNGRLSRELLQAQMKQRDVAPEQRASIEDYVRRVMMADPRSFEKVERQGKTLSEKLYKAADVFSSHELKQYKLTERVKKLVDIGSASAAMLESGDLSFAISLHINDARVSNDEERIQEAIKLRDAYEAVGLMRPESQAKGVKKVWLDLLRMMPPMVKTGVKRLVPYVGKVWAIYEWSKQGSADTYADMRKDGVSHETANAIVPLTGLIYAMIESLQFAQISGIGKAAMRKAVRAGLRNAFKKGVNKAAINKLRAIALGKLAATKGTDLAKEIGEESLQRLVTDSGAEIGKQLDDKSQKTFGEYWEEARGNMWEEAKGSAGPLTLLSLFGFGAGALNVGSQIKGDMENVGAELIAEKSRRVDPTDGPGNGPAGGNKVLDIVQSPQAGDIKAEGAKINIDGQAIEDMAEVSKTEDDQEKAEPKQNLEIEEDREAGTQSLTDVGLDNAESFYNLSEEDQASLMPRLDEESQKAVEDASGKGISQERLETGATEEITIDDDGKPTGATKQLIVASKSLADATTPEKKLTAINKVRKNVKALQKKNGNLSTEDQAIVDEADKVEAELKEQGYEIADLTGMDYNDGMKVTAEFANDENLDDGVEKIANVRVPQVMKDGKKVQAAEVVVSIGTRKSTEEKSGIADKTSEEPANDNYEPYKEAGDSVDGRKVRSDVPNMSSIDATIENAEVLDGVREVRMDSFALDEAPMPTDKETIALAEQIKESGELNPLIVGIDEKGPYIIEGAHRYDALKILGATSFPAIVAKEPTSDVDVGVQETTPVSPEVAEDQESPEFSNDVLSAEAVDESGLDQKISSRVQKVIDGINNSRRNRVRVTLETIVDDMRESVPNLTDKQYSSLADIAGRHPVTKLPSSPHLESFMDNARKEQKPGHILLNGYADLNGFKKINDGTNHKNGDNVMITVQSAIASLVGEYDQEFVGDYKHDHIGGDEMAFVFNVPLAEVDNVKALVSEVRELTNNLTVTAKDGTKLPLGISIGISEGYDVATADNVLKESKERLGKNSIGVDNSVINQYNMEESEGRDVTVDYEAHGLISDREAGNAKTTSAKGQRVRDGVQGQADKKPGSTVGTTSQGAEATTRTEGQVSGEGETEKRVEDQVQGEGVKEPGEVQPSGERGAGQDSGGDLGQAEVEKLVASGKRVSAENLEAHPEVTKKHPWVVGKKRDLSIPDPGATEKSERRRLVHPDKFQDKAYKHKNKAPSKFITISPTSRITSWRGVNIPDGMQLVVGKIDGKEQIQSIRTVPNKWSGAKFSGWFNANASKFGRADLIQKGRASDSKAASKQKWPGGEVVLGGEDQQRAVDKLREVFVARGYLSVQEAEEIQAASEPGTQDAKLTARIADALGLKILYVSLSERLDNPDVFGFNGLYVLNSKGLRGVIVINTKNDHAIMSVFGHEFVHSIRDRYPDVFEVLSKVAEYMLTDAGHNAISQRAKSAVDKAKSEAERQKAFFDASEEELADFAMELFAQPDFWLEVEHRQPGALEIVARVLKDILAKAQKALGIKQFNKSKKFSNVRAMRDALADATAEVARRENVKKGLEHAGGRGFTGIIAKPWLVKRAPIVFNKKFLSLSDERGGPRFKALQAERKAIAEHIKSNRVTGATADLLRRLDIQIQREMKRYSAARGTKINREGSQGERYAVDNEQKTQIQKRLHDGVKNVLQAVKPEHIAAILKSKHPIKRLRAAFVAIQKDNKDGEAATDIRREVGEFLRTGTSTDEVVDLIQQEASRRGDIGFGVSDEGIPLTDSGEPMFQIKAKDITQTDMFGSKELTQEEQEAEERKNLERGEVKARIAKRKGGEAGIAGLPMFDDQDVTGSQQTLFQRKPLSVDRATTHTSVTKLKSHSGYKMAKGGDAESSMRVVESVVSDDKIKKIKAAYPDAIVVAIHATEASGNNKLPHAYAAILAERGGFDYTDDIVQTNKVEHTGKGSLERLLTAPTFSGKVVKGREYIVVDDVITSGSTVRGIKEYIEDNGGNVVAVSSISATGTPQTGYGGDVSIKPSTVEKIKKGLTVEVLNDILRESNIAESIYELTNSQARYLANFKTAESLRNKISQARNAGFLQEVREKEARVSPEGPEQIKSATGNIGSFDPKFESNPGDFQRKGIQPSDKSLVAVHDLSPANIINSDRLGGIAMPSLATAKKENAPEGFGNITLIAKSEMVEPSRRSQVFDADVYSPRYPQMGAEVDFKAIEKHYTEIAQKYLDELSPDEDHYSVKRLRGFADEGKLWIAARSVAENIGSNPDQMFNNDLPTMAAYLREAGVKHDGTVDNIRNLAYEAGSKFDEYAAEKADRVIAKRRLFHGFTNLGNRKYADYTLDNIMREMKGNIRGGENFFYGAGSLRAIAAKKYRTLAQVKKDKDRLVGEEKAGPMKEEFYARLSSIASEIAQSKKDDNQFMSADNVASGIAEGLKRGNIRGELEDYGFTVTDEQIKSINQLITDLKAAPTEYFEVKIRDKVALDEFSGAVIPNDMPKKVTDILDKNNIPYVEYDPSVDGDRAAKVKEFSEKQGLAFQKGGQHGVYSDRGTPLAVEGRREADRHSIALALAAEARIHPERNDVVVVGQNDEEKAASNVFRVLFSSVVEKVRVAERIDSKVGFNGTYYNGKIYVNESSDNPFFSVVAHESTHQMEQQHPDLYKKLLDFQAGNITAEGEQRLAFYKSLGDKFPQKELLGDMIADEMRSTAWWKRLYEDSPEVAKRLLKTVLETINKVMRHLKGQPRTNASMFKDLQAQRKMVLDVYKEIIKREGKGQDATAAFDKPLMQIKAFHGSPHEFGKFESRPRTGEGVMAFGHGLYFTSRKDLAEHYVKNFKKGSITPDIDKMNEELSGLSKKMDKLSPSGYRQFSDPKRGNELAKRYDAIMDERADLASKAMAGVAGQAYEYSVTLHKGKTPSEYDYLKWDEIVKPKTVREVEKEIAKLPQNIKARIYDQVYADSDAEFARGFREMDYNGKDLYGQLSGWLGTDKDASDFLLRAGIDGIDYPSGTLSGGATGDRNYVVFDPDAVTIDERVAFQRKRGSLAEPPKPLKTKDAKAAWKIVQDADEYVPLADEKGVKHRVFFHSGTGDIGAIRRDGIMPMFGSWVSDVLSGATDENIDVDNTFEPLSFYSDIPDWLRVQVARKLNKQHSDVTRDDIRSHGYVAVVNNIDTRFDGPNYENIYRNIDEYGFNGEQTDIEDVYGDKKKLYETDLQEGKELFGIERGDFFTVENIVPDVLLSGDALLEFMDNYKAKRPDIRFQRKQKTEPFYSPTLRTIEAIKQEKGVVQQIRSMIKKGQFKKAEIEWMGLDEWLAENPKATKTEVLDFVRSNQVTVEETILGGNRKIDKLRRRVIEIEQEIDRVADPEDLYSERDKLIKKIESLGGTHKVSEEGPKYSSYTLPGGENYREVLFRMPLKQDLSFEEYSKLYRDRFPNSQATDDMVRSYYNNGENIPGQKNFVADKEGYRSQHFDEPNIFAHARLDDRTTPDGEKVLFIEELQSDWARDARDKGVGDIIKFADYDEYSGRWTARDESRNVVLNVDGNPLSFSTPDEYTESEAIIELNKMIQSGALGYLNKGGVPDFPFRKNWQEYALKNTLRQAVEGGYDRLSWINGTQTADRYDLSKSVKKVVYVPSTNTLFAIDNDGGMPINGKVLPDKVKDYIGKDAAEKLLATKPTEDVQYPEQILEGDDLKVGGNWAKTLYDKQIPNILNKYAKKWGAKVENVEIPSSEVNYRIIKEDEHPKPWAVVGKNVNLIERFGDFESADKLKNKLNSSAIMAQQSIPITDAMRESIETEGQPMFSRKTAMKQTEAKRFKNWFGKSVVKDAVGDPRIVYHGTGSEFTEFKPTFFGLGAEQEGSGYYFTSEPAIAVGYMSQRRVEDDKKLGGEEHQNVMPVFLKIEHPVDNDDPLNVYEIKKIITAAPEYEDALSNWGDVDYEGEALVLATAVEGYTGYEGEATRQLFSLANDFYSGHDEEFLKQINKIKGWDGIVSGADQTLVEDDVEEQHYVAWFPEQVKSATGNSGAFNPDEANVMFSRKSMPRPEGLNQEEKATYAGLLESEMHRLRGKLMHVSQERLADRAAVQMEINQYSKERDSQIRASVLDYAKKIGLQGEPHNRVATLVKNTRTSRGLQKAMDIMDSVLLAKQTRMLRNKVEQKIKDEHKYLKSLTTGKPKKSKRDALGNQRMREYIDQFAKVSGNKLESLQSSMDYFMNHPEEEMPADLRSQTASLLRKNLNDMNAQELQQVLNEINQINKLGKLKRELQEEQRLRKLDNSSEEAARQVREETKVRRDSPFSEAQKATYPKWAETMLRRVKEFGWGHIRPERLVEWFTKFKKSVLKSETFDKIVEAETQKYKNTEKTFGAFDQIHRNIDWNKLFKNYMTVNYEFIRKDGASIKEEIPLTLDQMMFIYANSLNPGNRAHLVGTGINDDIIDEVVGKMPGEYKAVVDAMVDYYDTIHYDRVSKEFLAEHNVEMPKEMYYFPIQNIKTDRAENAIMADLIARYSAKRNSVDKGFTKSRVKSKAAFKSLGYMDTVIRNLNQTEHYIAFNQTVKDVHAFLNRPELRSAMEERSDEGTRQVMDWLNAVAYGRVRGSDNKIDRVSEWFRTNYVTSVLGFNLITMMKQPASFSQGLKGTDKIQAAAASAKFMSNPFQMIDFVNAKSPMMKNRGSSFERELAEMAERDAAYRIMRKTRTRGKGKAAKALATAQDLVTPKTTMKTVKELSMQPIQAADKATTTILWYAKYQEMINKTNGNEGASIKAADALIRKTQPMGGIVHLPAIYRGGGFARAYTMFTNQLNQNLNLAFELQQTWGVKKNLEKAEEVFFYMIIPSMILYMASHGGNPPWEDPEEWAKMGISNTLGGVAFVNRLVDAGALAVGGWSRERRGGKSHSKNKIAYLADLTPTSLAAVADMITAIGTRKPGKAAEKAIESLLKFKGIPYAQVNRTRRGIKKAGETSDMRYLVWSSSALRDPSIMADNANRIKKPPTTWREMAVFFKWFRGLDGADQAKLVEYAVEKHNMTPDDAIKNIEKINDKLMNYVEVFEKRIARWEDDLENNDITPEEFADRFENNREDVDNYVHVIEAMGQ